MMLRKFFVFFKMFKLQSFLDHSRKKKRSDVLKSKGLLSILAYSCFLFAVLASSDSYSQNRHIAVVTRPGWPGEIEFAARLKKAGSNLNWKVDVVDFKDTAIDRRNYDFVICLVPDAYRSRHPTYLTLFDPKNHFFKSDGFLHKDYSSYNGYLITYDVSQNKKDFAPGGKTAWMQWYPTAQWIDYQEVDPSYLFYVCANWSQRSRDPRYKILLKLLDKKPYTRFYGLEHFKKLYPRSYVSFIPVDGEFILRTIQDCGVALVLHSLDHLDNSIPSGRIFEAVASSAVVICDKNPFVMNTFGDSVLYIEQNADGITMFKQIESHMDWIHTHPKEALEMAKRAHAIYVEKFLLEDQLLRLEEFHEKVRENLL